MMIPKRFLKFSVINALLLTFSLHAHAANDLIALGSSNQDNAVATNDTVELPSKYDAFQFEDSIDVHRTDIWERVRAGFDIPDTYSSYTEKHEAWYASRPEYIKRMLERSEKYLFFIVEEVDKRGMPSELALLPMVESAYNPKAYSSSKASGIWQFVPSTGKYFGLKQNYWADSRRDITAATDAALTYLQKLHSQFGSWDLALAAYNAGEGTVARAIKKNSQLGLPTDYESLSLPEETKNYVPKLQAIKNIISHPENYQITLKAIPNQPYFTTVNAPDQIDAKLAAELAGISMEEFNALNPSFNKPVIVANTELHQFLLPTTVATNFVENLANYNKPLSNWRTYKASRGERLDSIAQRFNIGLPELKSINNLSSRQKITSARTLLVPITNNNADDRIDTAALEQSQLIAKQEEKQDKAEPIRTKTISYIVKKGDTLYSLAKKFNMEMQSLLHINNIRSHKLEKGQTLKVISQTQIYAKQSIGHAKSSGGKATKLAISTKMSHGFSSHKKASISSKHKISHRH